MLRFLEILENIMMVIFMIVCTIAVLSFISILYRIFEKYASINELYPMIENRIIRIIDKSDQEVKTIFHEDKKLNFFHLKDKNDSKTTILVCCDESSEHKGMTIIHNKDGHDIILNSPKILYKIKMKMSEDE